MRPRSLLALILLLWATSVWPSDVALVLGPNQSDVDGWAAASVLEEGGHELTPAEALAASALFVAPPPVHGNLGEHANALWLRVPLQVSGGDDAWWVDLGFAGVDRADIYLFQAGQLVQTAEVRTTLPFSAKALPTRSQVIPLRPRSAGRHELLIRIDSTTAMLVPLRFVRPAQYLRGESRQQTVQGLIGGIWLCLMVYALVQWSALRERVFFDFALSSAAASLFFLAYFGHGPELLWGGNVWLSRNLWAWSILAMIGANAMFVHDALGLTRQDRRLGAALRAVAWASGITVAALLVGLLELRHAAWLASALGLLPTILGTVAAIRSLRRGNKAARLLIAGWSVVLLGTLCMVSTQQGWLPLNFWFEHALQLAMTIEIVLWMFVLALRVRQVRASDEASRSENALLHAMAFNDPLTGLLNRRGLYLALERSLAAALTPNAMSVYLLDLDEFKAANDRFGHDAGDALLIEVARRLKGQVRETDFVARLGGDEFVVVAHCPGNGHDAHAIGESLLKVIGEPFLVVGATAYVGATVGYAIAPDDATDTTTLLKSADAAMYKGKKAGRHQVLRCHMAAG